jgi:phage terminase large subunit-like protein
VVDVNVARGAARVSNDKVTRVNAITDLFASGYVWYIPGPDTQAVIDQFADFPAGSSDDLVDSATHALARLKTFVLDFRIRAEAEDEEDEARLRAKTGRRLYRM